MQEKDWLYVSARNFVILIATAALVLTRPADAQPLSIQGSDTLIYLGQRFAALYSRTSPDIQIIVRGGSAQAVKALSAEQADIAQFEGAPLSRGSLGIVSFPVGVQAIVVYVNESNPVRELTNRSVALHLYGRDHELESSRRSGCQYQSLCRRKQHRNVGLFSGGGAAYRSVPFRREKQHQGPSG
jgi:hypothetical protein